jgi:Uncharacterised protein family UPF0546.
MARIFSQHLQIFLVAAGAVVGQVLIKQGLRDDGIISFSLPGLVVLLKEIFTNSRLFTGCAISVISSILWLTLLSKMDLSYAAPMWSAFYFILLLVFSSWVLNEHVSAWRWSGTLLMMAGIWSLTRG